MQSKHTYLVLIGIITLAAGLMGWAIRSELSSFSVAMLAIGGVSLLAYVAMNINFLTVKLTRRSAVEGVNMVVSIVIFLAIVVFLEILLTRHSNIFDFTESKKFTLATQTTNLLHSLKEPLELMYLSEPGGGGERTKDLLELYVKQTDQLKYEIVDPEKEPQKVNELAPVTLGAVYVKKGERHEKVSPVDENNLTNALLKITKSSERVAYFTTGHGERSLNAPQEDREGISVIKSLVEEEGFKVQDLKLFETAEVPKDAAALIVAGPKTPFFEPEVEALKAYMNRGGKLYFLLDPRTNTGLNEFLQNELGVVLDNNVILENNPLAKLFGGNEYAPLMSKINSEHAMMSANEGRQMAVVFPITQSITLNEGALPEGVTGTWLIQTSERSFGESDIEGLFQTGLAQQDEGEKVGPLNVAVALTKPAAATDVVDATSTLEDLAAGTDEGADQPDLKNEARVIVFGDSDFINNLYSSRSFDLFLNGLNWMTHQEDLISIRPKDDFGQPIFVQATQAKVIFFTSLLIIPLAVALFGSVVCIRKRVRG